MAQHASFPALRIAEAADSTATSVVELTEADLPEGDVTGLADAPAVSQDIVAGRVHGRVVVDVHS